MPFCLQAATYSVQSSFLLTPFLKSSLRIYSKSGIWRVEPACAGLGNSFSSKTAFVSLSLKGQKIFLSLAALSTLFTVFLETAQLAAMFPWLRPRL